jgi:hypothetical protein
MKIALPLQLILSGLVLILIDRVIDKQKVIKLDKYLSRFVFLNRKKLFLLLGLPLPFLLYEALRAAPSLVSVGLLLVLILSVLTLGIISWIIFGGIIAYQIFKDSDNRPRWGWIGILALGTPLFLVVFLLLFLVRLTLLTLIYPVNGISRFNTTWFKSFLGLAGIALLGVGSTDGVRLLVSNIRLNNHLIVSLDWLGSILMLGTIWAWIYGKVSHPIRRRLTKADRRLKALDRLMKIKYGDAIENTDEPNVKDPVMRRFLNYRTKLGITSRMSFLERVQVFHDRNANIETAQSRDAVSRLQYEEAQQYRKDRNQLVALMLRVGLGFLRQKARHYLMTVVDRVTYSLFSGLVGAILFVVGFILWNLSKFFSLYTP